MRVYRFSFSLFLEHSDLDVLNTLYLPLLKLEAVALYHYLAHTSLTSTSFTESEILPLLGLTSNKFLKLKSKLEALGLLRTYSESGNSFILHLQKPLNKESFLTNSIFHSLFKTSVSTAYYDLVMKTINNNLDLSSFKDVSAPFDSVFTLSSISTLKKEVSFLFPTLTFASSFSLSLFYAKFREKPQLAKKEEQLIINVASLFDFDEDVTFKLFTLAYKDYLFDSKSFHRLAEEEFFKNNPDVKFNEVSRDLESLVSTFEQINLKQVLYQVKDKPTREDILNLSRLLDNLPPNISLPILNILLLIAINKTGSVPHLNYLLKIYDSFKEQGLYTLEDYCRYLLDNKDLSVKKQKTTYKKKQKQTLTPNSWQIEAWERIKQESTTSDSLSDLDSYLGDFNEKANN